MVVLEQEIASVIRFVTDALPTLTPYYQRLPEGFLVPAVYFPPPVMTSRGDTLKTYALEYDWHITFFASTDGDAQAHARNALNAICAARRLIPLIDESGGKTGKGVRLKDPSLDRADENAYQIELRWDSAYPYNVRASQKMMTYDLTIYTDRAYRAAVSKITQ